MTSMIVGYKLVDALDVVYQTWGGTWGQCPGVPNPLKLPNGDIVNAPSLNTAYEGYTLIEWFMEEPPPSVPASITRRQCALMLNLAGLISVEEALAMTKTAEVPVAIATLFANLSPSDQIKAEIDFGATDYYRNNPLIVFLMSGAGFSEGQADAFFISAAQL